MGAIDTSLPALAQRPDIVVWAKRYGLKSKDVNIRDLGVSVLEATKRDVGDNTLVELTRIMYHDEAIHVQCRAAFALFNHNGRTSSVIAKIRGVAEEYPELKEVAEGYLASLDKSFI